MIIAVQKKKLDLRDGHVMMSITVHKRNGDAHVMMGVGVWKMPKT